MTLEAQVLADRAVRATPDGYEIDLHLAWYRSLPLSCLEGIDLTIGDVTVPREEIRVRVDDEELPLDELAERDDQWWFVQDPLTFVVPAADPRPQGAEVGVDVVLATRIPYIIIGPETPLVQRTHVAKDVVVQ